MGNSQKNSRNSVLRLTKRPLGQILLDGGFISHSDLERALEQQKNTNELLGEILVNMGVLNPVDLKAVLSVNRDLASLEDAVKLAAGVRQLLGELLLQARRITPQQLELALQEHQRTGEKLGEVLVRLGLIARSELDAVLTFQQLQETKAATSGRLKLGEILVTTNQISRDHLEDALSRQQLSKKKIGDLLVKAGYVQPYQLAHGLNLQNKLLKAALVAVLSLAPLSNVQSAESIPQDTTSRSTIITAAEATQTHTALKVVHQTSELIITYADILRGYVDIPVAAHVEIRNENLAGYLIVFEGLGGPFKEVLVKGLGGEVKINSNSGWITQPYNGRDPVMVELSYRFILSENAKPGTYAWPLTISVSPILPV
jgi:hypothetical protein